MNSRLNQRIGPEIAEFRQQCLTLQLASQDSQGQLNVSYAPFVFIDGQYYVLISEIAKHARNLQQQPHIALMLIEDENQARQIYARRRLSYQALASLVARDNPLWPTVIEQLQQRFGEIIGTLAQLADFQLFALQVSEGRYVKGFGQAFHVDANGVDTLHLDQGHQPLNVANQ